MPTAWAGLEPPCWLKFQYMDDAVGHLRSNGREISDEHLVRRYSASTS